MGSVSYAFSVHHFINSVGADAGFAAFIGLAVLVLLYFAQARESATLRNHAYEAAQRIQALESRITQLSRQPAGAALPGATGMPPGASPAGGVGTAQGARVAAASMPSAVAAIPAAPAGVAAPALTAATKLIPSGPSPEPIGVGAPAPAAASPVGPVAAEPQPPGTAVAMPPPATAAGNGSAHEPAPAPARPLSAPPSAAKPPPPARPPVRPSGSAQAPRRPLLEGRGSSRGPGTKIIIALLGLLVVGAVVAILLIATSGGTKSANNPSAATTNLPTPGRGHHHTATFNPHTVTVAVLNGTATSGLAHRVAIKLLSTGYKQGTVATAADQTRTATIVAYMSGRKSDALHVASALKLGSASVQAIDPSTQAVACPPASPCTANVVVTVGSDLAGT